MKTRKRKFQEDAVYVDEQIMMVKATNSTVGMHNEETGGRRNKGDRKSKLHADKESF